MSKALRKTKHGCLILNGVRGLKAWELATAEYFVEHGETVEVLVPSLTANSKNADFLIWGIVWEAKSPVSTNRNTLTVMMNRAAKQSENIILDLRRQVGSEAQSLKLFRKLFAEKKRIKRLLIITKSGKLIEFNR